jgi:hypothetical protein
VASPELPSPALSETLGTQDNPHLTPHEHEARDLNELREDDPIHVDGEAIANAIRQWVREHQSVGNSPP